MDKKKKKKSTQTYWTIFLKIKLLPQVLNEILVAYFSWLLSSFFCCSKVNLKKQFFKIFFQKYEISENLMKKKLFAATKGTWTIIKKKASKPLKSH